MLLHISAAKAARKRTVVCNSPRAETWYYRGFSVGPCKVGLVIEGFNVTNYKLPVVLIFLYSFMTYIIYNVPLDRVLHFVIEY